MDCIAKLTTWRWWIYQRERFPVFAHGILVLAFSLSAICYSMQLRDVLLWSSGMSLITVLAILTAFISSFISFLHLRIADEFKDFEEDARWRPYRPVPRGLVSLTDLRRVWIATGMVQLVLALMLNIHLVGWLMLTWLYLALMTKEFFVRDWLTGRPVTYMLSHMLIMPLIDFYATACDWVVAQAPLPSGLAWFLATSFFNGIVIEIGRKIRSPDIEETGVNTYSSQWGMRTATFSWLAVMTATAICAAMAAGRIQFGWFASIGLAVFLAAGFLFGFMFLRQPTAQASRRIEHFSGLWTLSMYLILGVVPMGLRILGWL